MYNVTRETSEIYGLIINISSQEDGLYKSPYQVIEIAKNLKKNIEKSSYVRFLINEQILDFSALEKWAKEEYESLPKCSCCFHLLDEDVCVDKVTNKLFCSNKCLEYLRISQEDKILDEEEIDL